jgi:predicted nucleotidyltransferase
VVGFGSPGGYEVLTMAATANDTLIAEAGRRLAAAAPGSKVILFGSRARGEARSDSDLDLLVIEPEVESRRVEFVRLREALGDLGVPIDPTLTPAMQDVLLASASCPYPPLRASDLGAISAAKANMALDPLMSMDDPVMT